MRGRKGRERERAGKEFGGERILRSAPVAEGSNSQFLGVGDGRRRNFPAGMGDRDLKIKKTPKKGDATHTEFPKFLVKKKKKKIRK